MFEYKFTVEEEIMCCYDCPFCRENSYGDDMCGFLNAEVEVVEQKKIKCPLQKVENDKNKYNEMFAAFYAEYPRKVAKADALKAFRSLKPSKATFQKIMDSLNAFKCSRDWLKDGGAYVPYPATWLRQRRWEDETSAEPERSASKGEIPWI